MIVKRSMRILGNMHVPQIKSIMEKVAETVVDICFPFPN
ncbi:hypothetical protein L950_0221690 [Sphingobacterium sp. IITKGP-BTPF85]|nr:hypothetical protein L950_0221690 [Sphingobacterium sp. IITKGP-BTPF85]